MPFFGKPTYRKQRGEDLRYLLRRGAHTSFSFWPRFLFYSMSPPRCQSLTAWRELILNRPVFSRGDDSREGHFFGSFFFA